VCKTTDNLINGTSGGINFFLKSNTYLSQHEDTIENIVKQCLLGLNPQEKLQEWYLNFLAARSVECAGLWRLVDLDLLVSGLIKSSRHETDLLDESKGFAIQPAEVTLNLTCLILKHIQH
jgi:hypothetical protein